MTKRRQPSSAAVTIDLECFPFGYTDEEGKHWPHGAMILYRDGSRRIIPLTGVTSDDIKGIK